MAVFGYAWHGVAAVVGLVMCTVAVAPDAMSPKLQLNVLLLMLQAALAGLIDQLMPAPVGSGSFSVTDFATPDPRCAR